MCRLFAIVAVLLLAPAAHAAVPGVQAHRGGPVIGGVPTFAEESLPAFRNAAQELHTALELDAKLTKDGVPVVFHDDTLDRTTNCEGLVVDRTLAELAECPADVLGAPGNDLKTAPAPTPVPISTLADVLAFATADGALINLEIKNYPTDDDYDPTSAFANRVMDVVLESKIPARQVIIQSFTPANLEVAEQRMPDAELAFLSLAGSEDFGLSVAKMRGWDWVSPSWPVDKDFVAEAHASDIRVVPYTINQRDDVKAAAAAGVDSLITDDPLMALRTLDTKAPVVKLKLLTTKLAAVRRRGKLRVSISSNEAATVALNVFIGGGRVGISELRFEKAGTRKIKFGLSRAIRRALEDRKVAKVRLNAKWRDIAGNGAHTRVLAKLK
jgi:glycerophosphoryl diester phosphodiesterase